MSSLNHTVIGSGPAMRQAIELGRRCAQSLIPVLIVGQRSVGKDWLARLIHSSSHRCTAPLIKVHCGVASPEIVADHFRKAAGGTLLLEDIDQASLAVQCQLLLSNEQPPNSGTSNDCDGLPWPRLIATTVSEPAALLASPAFRQELFYLLGPATIHIPPVCEREMDIPAFVQLFLTELCGRNSSENRKSFTSESMDQILSYPWPGNLAQLQCCVQRAVLLSDSDCIEINLQNEISLWDSVRSNHREAGHCRDVGLPTKPSQVPQRALPAVDLDELTRLLITHGIVAAELAGESLHPFIVNSVEKELIAQVLNECENIQTKAAGRLGINRNTLHKKVKEYDLEAESSKGRTAASK